MSCGHRRHCGGIEFKKTNSSNCSKEHYRSKQKYLKKKRNEYIKNNIYRVGDTVVKKNVKSLQRKGGKIESKFLGPFTIVGLEGKVAQIRNDKDNTEMVNIDNLKSFRIYTGRVPHKPKTENFKNFSTIVRTYMSRKI